MIRICSFERTLSRYTGSCYSAMRRSMSPSTWGPHIIYPCEQTLLHGDNHRFVNNSTICLLIRLDRCNPHIAWLVKCKGKTLIIFCPRWNQEEEKKRGFHRESLCWTSQVSTKMNPLAKLDCTSLLDYVAPRSPGLKFFTPTGLWRRSHYALKVQGNWKLFAHKYRVIAKTCKGIIPPNIT